MFVIFSLKENSTKNVDYIIYLKYVHLNEFFMIHPIIKRIKLLCCYKMIREIPIYEAYRNDCETHALLFHNDDGIIYFSHIIVVLLEYSNVVFFGRFNTD